MKKLLPGILLLISSYNLLAQDADGLLIRVKQKLEKVKDYTGDATLSVKVPFMNVPDSKVKVYFRQPDQLKISKPDGISILPKGGMSVSLNSLISGKDFTAVPGGYISANGRKLAVIKLLPLDNNSTVVLAVLHVEESTSLVIKAITTTKDNGTYESELHYGRYADWALPDNIIFIFNAQAFKLPKGVTMEYEGSRKPATSNGAATDKGKVILVFSNYAINKGISPHLLK